MGKDTRIGFAVVGSLAVLFFAVLYGRVHLSAAPEMNIESVEDPHPDRPNAEIKRLPTIVKQPSDFGPLISPALESPVLSPPSDSGSPSVGQSSFLPEVGGHELRPSGGALRIPQLDLPSAGSSFASPASPSSDTIPRRSVRIPSTAKTPGPDRK